MATDPELPPKAWTEPSIVINGRALTIAECLAVRVAITTFRLRLQEPSVRHGLGEELAMHYDHRLAGVERTIIHGHRTSDDVIAEYLCRTRSCGHGASEHRGPNGACVICQRECWM